MKERICIVQVVEGVGSQAGLIDSRCFRLAGVQADDFLMGPVGRLGSNSKHYN